MNSLQVAARPGRPEAALARDEGARVVYVDELQTTDLPVAAEHWRIVALGRTAGDVTLKKQSHVMAAPPGENGWLLLVDRFLQSRRSRIEKLLVEHADDDH